MLQELDVVWNGSLEVQAQKAQQRSPLPEDRRVVTPAEATRHPVKAFFEARPSRHFAVREVADALRLPVTPVSAAIYRLVEDGVLERLSCSIGTQAGRYRWKG